MRGWVLALLIGALVCAGCGKKEKATPDLINDLKSGGEGERVAAARTLPNRNQDATQVVPALIEALKDKEADVRRSAAIGLGGFGEQAKDAVPGLQTALGDRDARVREAAANALTKVDPIRFPAPPKSKGK